jgi:hypothetical protein
MINLKNTIQDAVQAIEQTTTLFYQQKNSEGYQQLNQTLNSLMQAVDVIITAKVNGNHINIDEQKLNAVLGRAMTAIENEDTILLSDILVFELKCMLEDCYYRL